ncbi:unnamed protein product, partial [Onchocerca ochengi]|uniref:IS66 family insertion sequence element accessory protein TnpB n=1 Tax=Onchocerca ochengi TaxID=42157 RepID=A0A182F099_ONCOC
MEPSRRTTCIDKMLPWHSEMHPYMPPIDRQ